MVQRCTNPRRADFGRYGGAGVTVCERWRVFANFLADMGAKPSASHSLDRIDPQSGYEPGNVRWATSKEQSRNRKNTRLIAHAGQVLCVTDWALELGISKFRLSYRIRRGWSIQQVIDAKPYARADGSAS